MEPPGIESPSTSAPNVVNRRVNDAEEATRGDDKRREVSASVLPGLDAVEVALAEAIRGATSAGRWDVVAQLARELEARRMARALNVIAIDTARTRRAPTS